MKKLLAIFLLLALPVSAQITLPNETFLPGQIISAGPTNANFGTLGDQALNRTGGTITGHITVDANVTIDGVDISDYLDGAGRVFGSAFGPSSETTTHWAPGVASNVFTLAGVSTATLNASGLSVFGNALVNSSGKIPGLTSTYLASVDASTLMPGEASIADGALLARLAAGETISGQWQFNPGTINANTPTSFQANWNNAGVAFTGLLIDITNTASNAASTPLNVRLAGVSKVSVTRAGKTTAATMQVTGAPANTYVLIGDGSGVGTWTPSATASPLPSGLLAWFEAACPSGWTIKSNAANTYDGKFPRGGATFGSGGADTHTHSLDPPLAGSTAVSADHSHTWDLGSETVDSSGDSDHDLSGSLASGGGSHDHAFTTDNASSSDFIGGGFGQTLAFTTHTHSGTTNATDISHTHALGVTDTSRDGGHAHSEDFASTGSSGISANHSHTLDIASFSSASGSNIPAYVQVVVCRKD